MGEGLFLCPPLVFLFRGRADGQCFIGSTCRQHSWAVKSSYLVLAFSFWGTGRSRRPSERGQACLGGCRGWTGPGGAGLLQGLVPTIACGFQGWVGPGGCPRLRSGYGDVGEGVPVSDFQ